MREPSAQAVHPCKHWNKKIPAEIHLVCRTFALGFLSFPTEFFTFTHYIYLADRNTFQTLTAWLVWLTVNLSTCIVLIIYETDQFLLWEMLPENVKNLLCYCIGSVEQKLKILLLFSQILSFQTCMIFNCWTQKVIYE